MYGGDVQTEDVVKRTRPEPEPPPPVGKGLNYSIHEPWDKTNEETRTLFRELEKLVNSLGSVQTDLHKSEISFKCTAAPGDRPAVVAYVHVRVRSGLRVHIHGKHLSAIPLEDGFTRPYHGDKPANVSAGRARSGARGRGERSIPRQPQCVHIGSAGS